MGLNCYIDESGDEGINTGGTRWFILGAVIVEESADLQTSSVIPRIKRKLGKNPKAPLHWAQVRSHDKKLYICSELLSEQWTFSAVVADKQHPFVLAGAGLKEKHKLYNYSARLLLERLSWYACDHGNQIARLIFDKRTNTDYSAIGQYFS